MDPTGSWIACTQIQQILQLDGHVRRSSRKLDFTYTGPACLTVGVSVTQVQKVWQLGLQEHRYIMYVSLLVMVYRWIVVHTGTCFTDGLFRSYV